MTPRENLSAMGPKELRTSKLFENAISPRKGSDAQRDRDSITKTHGPRVASKHQPPRRSNEHLINSRRRISLGKPSRPSVRISTDEFVVDKNALRNSVSNILTCLLIKYDGLHQQFNWIISGDLKLGLVVRLTQMPVSLTIIFV